MSHSIPQIDRLNELILLWKTYRAPLGEPDCYCQLKTDLYQVRNPGWNGCPPLSVWPAYLLDSDDSMMAAVEPYFLCRCWGGSGTFPAWQMRTMNVLYDMGKLVGVAPRHNPNKPISELTALQMAAKEAGIRDGRVDLTRSGKSAPILAAPPKY